MKEKKEWMKKAAAGIVLAAAIICFMAGLREPEPEPEMQGILAETESEPESETEQKPDETEEQRKPEPAEKKICVHVCGEVQHPGVYEFREGDRLFRAIEAAGGLTEEAAEDAVNQAEKLSDGQQVRVPDREEAKAAREAQEGGSAPVNLNLASRELLMTLPGIGESRAQDILDYREQEGPFQKIEDIMKVSGIKEAAFQKIKDLITV